MPVRPSRPVNSNTAGAGDGEKTLTVAETAELLRCSRPYVRMLLGAGHLNAKMNGRDLRITRVSVFAYSKSRVLLGDADYKRAAESAGMYAVPDAAYLEAIAKRHSTKMGER